MNVPTQFAPRLAQLTLGLALFGFTLAVMLESGIGLPPWDVFHQGLAHHIPLTFGQVVMVVGALVLLLWIPLRQKPGIGTVLNVILVGLAADFGLAILPAQSEIGGQVAFLGLGIVGNGVAGALYVGARLGSGPRDGLWVGLVERTGLSIRKVRTFVEATVLIIGFLLGGLVGLGTVLYAVAIGPLTQLFLPAFDHETRPARRQPLDTRPRDTEYLLWLANHPVKNLY